MTRKTKRIVGWIMFTPAALAIVAFALYAFGWVVYQAWSGSVGARATLAASAFFVLLFGGAAILLETERGP